MEKPKLTFEDMQYGDGQEIIERAVNLLNAYGMRKLAKSIHQEASVEGYDFYVCLQLLKKYALV